jgi:hypothetical protein
MTKNTTVTVQIEDRKPFQFSFDGDGKLHAIECREDHDFGRTERALKSISAYMEKEAWNLVERIMNRRFKESHSSEA